MEGKRLTDSVYAFIRDEKYDSAKRLLSRELARTPKCRALLSLLGYCCYHMQDYEDAAAVYEELAACYPDQASYQAAFTAANSGRLTVLVVAPPSDLPRQVNLAQSLLKAGELGQASSVCKALGEVAGANPQQTALLAAWGMYEGDDLEGLKSLLSRCDATDPEVATLCASRLWKEGKYELALETFRSVLDGGDFDALTAYNVALCHYELKQYTECSGYLRQIIKAAVESHPELELGPRDPEEVVGTGLSNSAAGLKDTALIEAVNLRSAIDFRLERVADAAEKLDLMPWRPPKEVDAVTVHNQALFQAEENAGVAFNMLRFLIDNPPFPPEAFANLAQRKDLVAKYLTEEEVLFLEALIISSSSPDEAIKRLEAIAGRYVEKLQKTEHAMEVLMAQANIFWARKEYDIVERGNTRKPFSTTSKFLRATKIVY
ncbi:tetratricopeptide repeat-containing protein [Cystoisospora suis]|uniref:Tetratricopeptide repeat-containing protein n=1 Tax=Cystoisospora suis TaxID=483139 RepID=A0A2C6KY83_9APIC|nr:tetratricopeptide repeat-containing protein [Cystoisospora suis]